MPYLVLARKWRPRAFDEIVGQMTVIRTLQNALASGRIGQAFLFSGARGVGKTTTARILAKALNCTHEENPTPNPCGACSSCIEIAASHSLDVQEIDGATHNGVEQIRELRESTRYNPVRDRFKIWIIDEVHMLSTGAFNALLKTLEEPPPRVKFIFATTEYHKLPDTILSRCQQFDFRMIPARELVAHLRKIADVEEIQVLDKSLSRIARAAEGSARDALSLFDQILSFSGPTIKEEDISSLLGLIDRELLLAASQAVAQGNNLALLDLVEQLSEYGADYRNFIRELLLYFREILLLKLAPETSPLLAQIAPEEREKMHPLLPLYSEEDLLRAFEVLSRAEGELRWALDSRVILEWTLLKLAQMRKILPFSELVERVEQLATGAGVSLPVLSAPHAETLSPSKPIAFPSLNSQSIDLKPELGSAEVLAGMVELAKTRPSLLHPLRSAHLRREEDALVLEVTPDVQVFVSMHLDDYRDLACKVVGQPIKVRVGDQPSAVAISESSHTADRQRRMRLVEKEPVVREVLELFKGTVVDIRTTRDL